MSISAWAARLTIVGASPTELAAIESSYYADAPNVQAALDTLVAGISNADLRVMLNTWRTSGAPFHAGYPGGGLPFGTGVPVLTGNPADDSEAISAGTGEKLSLLPVTGARVQTGSYNTLSDYLAPAPVGDSSIDTGNLAAAIVAAAGERLVLQAGAYSLDGSGSELLLMEAPLEIVASRAWQTVLQIAASVPNTTDVFRVAPSAPLTGFAMSGIVIAPINGPAKTITAATNATPIQLTATAHGFSTGQTVTVAGVLGNTDANGTWVITKLDANNFTLNGSSGNAAYTSGGTAASVPGRHGINLDVSGGNYLSNPEIDHCWIRQLGGRAIVTNNPAPLLDGVFVGDVHHNVLYGGVDLSKAGDSLAIRKNTITGAFNAVDVDLVQSGTTLGAGAHCLSIYDNNVTSQGAFVRILNGSSILIGPNNNVEPAYARGCGVDSSNAPNSATVDIDGSATTPSVRVKVTDNFLGGFGPEGDVVRVNHARGAIVEDNDCERETGGGVNYRITANAVGTRLVISPTEDETDQGSQVDDQGTGTVIYFYDETGLLVTGASQAYARVIEPLAYASTVTVALPTPAADIVANVGTLTGAITLANPTGTPVDGQTILYRFRYDATGGYTITWDTEFAFGTDVEAAMIPSAASSKWEQLFRWCAADSTWRAEAIVRGF